MNIVIGPTLPRLGKFSIPIIDFKRVPKPTGAKDSRYKRKPTEDRRSGASGEFHKFSRQNRKRGKGKLSAN